MRCAIIKQTTLKNIAPRVIKPYRPSNPTFSYLLRIVSQMRNGKNPSSQVCVLKVKMEMIKKRKIENINLYSFVHFLFVSHHRIATVCVHPLRVHSRPQCLLFKRICGQEFWGRD